MERGKIMRMERLSATMARSTVKKFHRYAELHDMDLCMVAKIAVTEYSKVVPPSNELETREMDRERIFVSMPDTAMRLLELWAENTGIPKQKLLEWAIKKLTEKKEEEQK